MKLSDYVVDFVASQKVGHVFMLPGGGAMHLNDSLGKHKKVKYICNLHEQAAAIAADAYSQYTKKLGVAMVTTGPGGTNAITGLAGSWLDSVPVLYISGQVKSADLSAKRQVRQMGFQEIDTPAIVDPITKYAITVTDPKSIRYHLEKAAYLATSGRPGPVWVDIPLDIQAAEITPKSLKSFKPPKKKAISKTQMTKWVQQTIKLLKEASRPVILVGNGVRSSGAESDFLKLIQKLKIPVLTTWKAIDFLPEDHKYYVGRPGAIGQRGANFTQQTCDLLFILGSRLDFGQTAYNHKNFAPKAKKIIVDIDTKEINKLETKVHVPIVCDAGQFIRELNKKVLPKPKSNKWLKKCKAWQKQYPVILPEYWNQKKYVNDYVLLQVLAEEMNANDLLVPGSSGACSERAFQAFPVKKGMRIFNSQGLGSMGFGIAMAIGGCIASNKKRTITIEGDGGFIMNVQELELARRMKLPIKFFILNNDGYVSIRTTQKNYFNSRFMASSPKSGVSLPDYKKIAKAFNLNYVKLRSHKDIRKNIKKVLNTKGPVICEVMVSPDQTTQPRVSSKKLDNGKMISLPMEDLWPFLDRKEFEEQMSSVNKI